MNHHTCIQANASPAILGTPSYPDLPPRPAVLLTVSQFAQRNPAFSASAMRNLIFKAQPRLSTKGPIQGNGLTEAGAIVRLGRKVLIDEARFFGWLEAQQRRGQ